MASVTAGSRIHHGRELRSPEALTCCDQITAAYSLVCVHELIEKQAATTPDRLAARYSGRQLTYRELNAKANQIANYLIKCGVGPEVLVAISVERSLEMLIALLGILKAGGAYLPLDPAFPPERRAFM